MSFVINEHRTYLSDRARLAAYTAAIQDVVRAGDVVLDLGCGTGILGLLACRSGAARVYAIDSTGMIEVARRLAKDNGLSDRIVHVNEWSLDANLAETVDVVVCDQMGSFGFDGGVVQYLADARERFLKPNGRLIPRSLSLVVAPVEAEDLRRQVEFWGSAPAGLEFDSVRRWAVNTSYVTRYQSQQMLGAPVLGKTLDLMSTSAGAFDFTVTMTVLRAGTFHGVAGWFSAELASGVVMTNSPLEADAIDRHSAFFPLENVVAVREGDLIDLTMHIFPVEKMITWKTSVTRPSARDASPVHLADFVHSTFNAMFLSREGLTKSRPGFRPRLTRRGEARAFALALCNGDHPLAEIEDSLFANYPDLFRRRDQASVFVGQLIEHHTE